VPHLCSSPFSQRGWDRRVFVGALKDDLDLSPGAEECTDQDHRQIAVRTGQRISAFVVRLPLCPGSSRLFCKGAGSRLFEGSARHGKVAVLPTVRKEPCVPDHREGLIGNVPHETSDESEDTEGHVAGRSALGVVFVGKTDDLPVVGSDPIFSQYSALRISPDVVDTEAGIDQGSSDECVPGEVPEPVQKGSQAPVLREEVKRFRKTPLLLSMCSLQTRDHLVLPSALQSLVRHQESWISRDPPPFVQTQSASRDDEMYVGIPLQVRAKCVHDRHDPHPHRHDVSCPLLNRLRRSLEEQVQSPDTIHRQDNSQLPRDRQDDVMIRHVQHPVQHLISPLLRGVLSARRTEPALA